MEITIEYVPINEIKRAPRNAKEHDLGALSISMRRFGNVNPMLEDTRTGRLVYGHGRLETLLGMKSRSEDPPEGIKIRDDGMWLAPVVRGVRFASDSEAEAYGIADNRITELGGWDEPLLVEALASLAAEGDEMLEGIGFDADDLDEYAKSLGGEEREPNDGEEDVPPGNELLEKWGVKTGDIWAVGNHIVVCNDCRSVTTWEDMLIHANTDVVNGAITSPPYAEQRKGEYGGIREDYYLEWWEDIQWNIKNYLAKDGSFFLNIKPHVVDGERVMYVTEIVLAMKQRWDWCFIDEFSWPRISSPGSWPNRFKNGFEPVYQFGKIPYGKFRPDNVKSDTSGRTKSSSTNVNTGSYYHTDFVDFTWEGALPSNVLDIKFNTGQVGHPAAFPVELAEFFIRAYSDPGDVWVDPFAGSGSALLACERNDRVGLGIELLPEYVAVTIERLAEATGQEPEKL